MGVRELTRSQLTQVKERYYCERNDNVSWGELASIDTLVSDDEVFEEFGGTEFVEDDFF